MGGWGGWCCCTVRIYKCYFGIPWISWWVVAAKKWVSWRVDPGPGNHEAGREIEDRIS